METVFIGLDGCLSYDSVIEQCTFSIRAGTSKMGGYNAYFINFSIANAVFYHAFYNVILRKMVN